MLLICEYAGRVRARMTETANLRDRSVPTISEPLHRMSLDDDAQ
jgi:hypothetical protein